MPNERSGVSLLKTEKGMYLFGIDTSPFIKEKFDGSGYDAGESP